MEKQPESVRRFPSAKGEWIRVGEKENRAQLGNVAVIKVTLVLVMPREVVMLGKHSDSVTLLFAHAVEDKRQEWGVTDSLNLNTVGKRNCHL